MRLIKARVQNYRSIRDSGYFDVERDKTILVGSNEAGKTAILRALQQINPPPDVPKFDPLRDFPRALYNDITVGKAHPAHITVVEAHFVLEEPDRASIGKEFHQCTYVCGRKLDNGFWDLLEGCPALPTLETIEKQLKRLCSHIDSRVPPPPEGQSPPQKPSEELAAITENWLPTTDIADDEAQVLEAWLDKHYDLVDEDNEKEEERHSSLLSQIKLSKRTDEALAALRKKVPIFVLFSNYFRVRPSIHLEQLAIRVEQKVLDDDQYDYGNLCLLKILGFTPRTLSDLGKAGEPNAKDSAALKNYKDQLDKRAYQLNAASVGLTREIRKVWNPNPTRAEADKLRVNADAQYLKVVVEDDLGVEIELDQRSEGFQWLVSFFVVFFAEAQDKHKNAILLLDEPGMSLHGLKQRDFRETVSRLATTNQTLFTTHSPFLVGPDELDLVRVVEMKDRNTGTKVHTTVAANDPASLLPLQEALGYDLAQSLFTQQRNLVLEGLTDFWYVEAVAALLRDAGEADLNEKIALIPANSAGKVVYFATILHANNLKVAALLDADAAGDQAAKQDTLINALGNKRILRTKDVYAGMVNKPEVEDLLRATLISIAKDKLAWDVSAKAASQPTRSIVDVFEGEVSGFSKYRLAKEFVRWTRDHKCSDLAKEEREAWSALIAKINAVLK